MKIKITLFIALILSIAITWHYISKLKSENKRLTNNQEVLLSENKQFKIRDSISVVRSKQLEFKISELERYRVKDLELIEDLKISKSSLEGIVSANTETIKKLSLALRDSIRIDTVTNQIDTLKCFNYRSMWTDVDGCINTDSIDLQISNRESLKIVQSLEKKKFWFIKLPIWLFGYKTKQVDVVSENPATSITNVEFITVKK